MTTDREALQEYINQEYDGKYIVIPKEAVKTATDFYSDKMITAYSRGGREGTTHFSEAGIARVFLRDIFGLKSEKQLSDIASKAREKAGVKL